MKNENQNIDQDAFDFTQQEHPEKSFTEEEFLIELLNSISPTVLSDEFYERNKDLVRSMSNGFRDRHTRRGDMTPALARASIEILLSSIAKFGWR